MRWLLSAMCTLAAGCAGAESLEPGGWSLPAIVAADDPAPGWLKGQLHVHSNASGDSETPPEQVVTWYAAHGYDFVVFTDHNRVTQVSSVDGMLVLPGVELTQNPPTCDPPPQGQMQCLLHVNALVVDPSLIAAGSSLDEPSTMSRVDRFAHAIDVTRTMGGVAQLNHPNFHYAATADDLLQLTERGLGLFEVANEAWDSNNEGDQDHLSTTQMWDAVLSSGGRIYGTAAETAPRSERLSKAVTSMRVPACCSPTSL